MKFRIPSIASQVVLPNITDPVVIKPHNPFLYPALRGALTKHNMTFAPTNHEAHYVVSAENATLLILKFKEYEIVHNAEIIAT